jgi:putative peptidoglycan lipid II flippase
VTASAAIEGARNPGADARKIAADSRTVATWTLIGRLSGFVRVAAIAAVFGPTFFGNLFQSILLTPYLLCELMAGSLITTLLGPHLVHALEESKASAERLARGFLGTILGFYVAMAVGIALIAPGFLWLLTFTVDDPAVRARQMALGVPLLLLVLPQVVFYAIGAVAISVQQSHRRFAFATAAPIIENVGTILVLGLSALIFGIGFDVEHVSTAQLLLLGLGSTAAVGLHVAAQWWGAYRLGVTLFPRRAREDGRVRDAIRLALPSWGAALLNSLALFALLAASGGVPGGTIAFQIGMNFYNLPLALGAYPVAAAQSPLLSRHFAYGDLQSFGAAYRHCIRLVLFLTLPACAIFIGIPAALAAVVSFGAMAHSPAISLIAAVLSGLGFGIVGEALFVVARSAAFARLEASTTLRAMIIRSVIIAIGIPLALLAGTPGAELRTLGLAYSAAAIAAAGFMTWRTARVLPQGDDHWGRWLAVNAGIAAVAALPSILTAPHLDLDGGHLERIATGGLLLALTGAIYLAAQYARGSAELRTLLGLAHGQRGTASTPTAEGSAS